MELQGKYYVALMEYWLNGIEPSDPVIKSLLQWPMYSIQKTNEWLKKKSQGWKNHTWNQYTKGDTKWKAQKDTVEDSGTYMEDNGTEWNKEDKEDNRSNIKKEIIKEKKTNRFEEFWNAYPLKKWKKKAEERYNTALKNWVSEDLLITKAKEYAEECRIKNTELKYIKRPEGWINGWRYEDTYITAKPKQVKSEDKPYDFTQKPTLIRPKLPWITNLKKEY